MLSHHPKLSTGTHKDALLPQLIEAIYHASHIEVAVSFVQPSGLDLLFEPLSEALESGAQIDFLTSDYLGITHPKALRQLLMLAERGAQVRIFCCRAHTSFHLKTYIFTRNKEHRIDGGCAFIGSNNISRTALLDAHEWAWRHDWHSNPQAAADFALIRQAFQQIFTHPDTLALDANWIDAYAAERQKRLPALQLLGPLGHEAGTTNEQPAPNPVQVEALQALEQSRRDGFMRGLVVLATGMGKTWLAAFDCLQLKAKRVLFVAHREEILLQAQHCFSKVHPDARTGLYKGARKDDADFLFASVLTIGKAQALEQFAPDHFDYVVVDEFHHASAASYQTLLRHFQPQFLLGLTATPERTDQADILGLCDNNLVYERNLVHGIDQNILAPFHYYGIFDSHVNYQEIPWRSGRFDPAALEHAFATRQRARHIFQHWQQHTHSRTLGFCVSRQHADYMADYFSRQGVRAAAVYSGSQVTRHAALQKISSGELDILFAVDLFNEGTDIPPLDCILMLRPTESKIIFLQQLGRGLRLSPETGKSHLLVLDFLGNHQSFLTGPAALLNDKDRRNLLSRLENTQDITLADGCYLNFDPQLTGFWQELRRQLGSSAVEDYQLLRDELGRRPTASEFFHKGLALDKVRRQHGSWLALVAHIEDEQPLQQLQQEHGEFFLQGLETTAMTKSFKAFLYLAMLELDGIRKPVAVSELARHSRKLLEHRPDSIGKELPVNVQNASGDSKQWLAYWRKNPVFYSCQQDRRSSQAWFVEQDDCFGLNFKVAPELLEPFTQMFAELVQLRLAQYFSRPENYAVAAVPRFKVAEEKPG